MAVTIYDVAERTGVGIATVSRVLNSSPHVREVTRQRLLDARRSTTRGSNHLRCR
jgi:LacI family transcriptional regulator